MNNATQAAPVDEAAIRTWMVKWLSRELKLAPTEISPDESLLTYGMDSINAIMLVGDMEDYLGLRLPPTLVWDFPTVNRLVDKALSEQAALGGQSSPAAENGRSDKRSIDTMDIAEAKQLLERLDELSDADVEALLARLSQET